MAIFSANGTLSDNSVIDLSNSNTTNTRHQNDSLKSTHYVQTLKTTSQNTIITEQFLVSSSTAHKTLLSTLYAGQDKYIVDAWLDYGPNGEYLINTLATAKDTNRFVFVRDSSGNTFNALKQETDSYVSVIESPIPPEEFYVAAPSRIVYKTSLDSFSTLNVFSGYYEFGSVCDTTDLETQLSQCLDEKNLLQAQLDQCQADLAQAQTDLASCQNDLSTCQSDLSTCQSNLNQCTSDLATCNNNLSTCQTDLSTCQTDLTSCQAENAQLQSDLSSCSSSLSDCQTTVINQQNTIDTLNAQILDLQNQIISLQNQLADLLNQIDVLQNALDDCTLNTSPYRDVVSFNIIEKEKGLLVQVQTAGTSDLYLFVKDKNTGEIVKSVKSLTTTDNHVVFIPIGRGNYIIDYLAIKPV